MIAALWYQEKSRKNKNQREERNEHKANNGKAIYKTKNKDRNNKNQKERHEHHKADNVKETYKNKKRTRKGQKQQEPKRIKTRTSQGSNGAKLPLCGPNHRSRTGPRPWSIQRGTLSPTGYSPGVLAWQSRRPSRGNRGRPAATGPSCCGAQTRPRGSCATGRCWVAPGGRRGCGQSGKRRSAGCSGCACLPHREEASTMLTKGIDE